MTLSPPAAGFPTPMTISTMTDDIVGAAASGAQGGASAVWPTAATAYFYPIPVSDRPRTYTKAWWLNGATAAGNVDVGIYTIAGTTATRVVASTAVAQGTISTLQVAATFTTTTLDANVQYWIAMSMSLATGTAWRTSPTTTLLRVLNCFQAATAHPLPASITVVALTSGHCPAFGFSENAAV